VTPGVGGVIEPETVARLPSTEAIGWQLSAMVDDCCFASGEASTALREFVGDGDRNDDLGDGWTTVSERVNMPVFRAWPSRTVSVTVYVPAAR
jgi:hypothetical protein